MLAWLFARSSGGGFIVRMEDLDPVTSSKHKANQQLADLAAIGLDWDGEVVFQSDRFPLYDATIERLEAGNLTYPCFCTRREIADAIAAPHGLTAESRYPGTCRHLSAEFLRERISAGRKYAIRLRVDQPELSIEVRDQIAGLFVGRPDDIVLRRNDGMPAYNLAVVVDDELQGIEHVVRGDDLLSSSPSQMVLGSILRFRRLSYAHIPLTIGPTGQRLAKRDGAVTLEDLRSNGQSASDVCALLGASLALCRHGETVTTETLLARFDPAVIPRDPWVIGSAR